MMAQQLREEILNINKWRATQYQKGSMQQMCYNNMHCMSYWKNVEYLSYNSTVLQNKLPYNWNDWKKHDNMKQLLPELVGVLPILLNLAATEPEAANKCI